MNLHLNEHISQQFNAELEGLRNRVLSLGGLVEQQVHDAVAAIASGDTKLAESVVQNDYKVNAAEVSIDEECNRILALRQPTASDLRLVMAVVKTITDLERIGDEAKKVAKFALKLSEQDRPSDNYRAIQNFGTHVEKMIHDALDAFARLDPQAALEVVKEDVAVDSEYEGIMRQSMTFMLEDPRTISRVMNVMWAVRSLERVGDHAKNMSEYVIYLVKGKDVRHTSIESMTQQVES